MSDVSDVSGVTIGRGTAADLPLIMPVMRAAFDVRFGEAWSENQCLGVLAMPGASLLIAREGDPIGFALSRTIVGSCELMLLAVSPQLQQRGIGRMLLNKVITDARTMQATHLFLEMRSGNPALALYSSAGFVEVGCRRDYYHGANGDVFDAMTYRQTLA